MNEPAIDLAAYIREQRERFTREALTAQLQEAGHTLEAIDTAWAAVEREPSQPVQVSGLAQGLQVIFLLVLIGGYGGSILLALFGLNFGSYLGAQSGIVLGAYIVALIPAGIWAGRRLLDPQRASRGAMAVLGGAFVAAAAYAGLSGACFVLLRG